MKKNLQIFYSLLLGIFFCCLIMNSCYLTYSDVQVNNKHVMRSDLPKTQDSPLTNQVFISSSGTYTTCTNSAGSGNTGSSSVQNTLATVDNKYIYEEDQCNPALSYWARFTPFAAPISRQFQLSSVVVCCTIYLDGSSNVGDDVNSIGFTFSTNDAGSGGASNWQTIYGSASNRVTWQFSVNPTNTFSSNEYISTIELDWTDNGAASLYHTFMNVDQLYINYTYTAVPAAPTLVSALNGNSQITLSWSAPTDNGGSSVTGYDVYRGISPSGETYLTQVSNTNTYIDSGNGLSNQQTYYYYVVAINGVGTGVQSNEMSAVYTVPTSPLVTSSGVSLPWIWILIGVVAVVVIIVVVAKRKGTNSNNSNIVARTPMISTNSNIQSYPRPTTIFCPSCGKPLPPNVTFCPGCGNKIP